MPYLLCGSENGSHFKDNTPGIRPNGNTPQCFGLARSYQEPANMESFTVVVKRGKTGFGFTVTGSSPAKIKAVREESPAFAAGLRKGDCVIRINGEKVSGFLAESVAKIVRQSQKQIVLDIERVCRVDTQDATSPISDSQLLIPVSQSLLMIAPQAFQQQQQQDNNQLFTIPENGNIVSSACPDNYLSKCDWNNTYIGRVPSLGSIAFNDLSAQEQKRQHAIHEIIQCEKDFLSQMQLGIERYSSPLRHDMISPAEHATLFQNVEKLVSISEYNMYKLEEASVPFSDEGPEETSRYIDTVGSAYLAKLSMITEVFEQYCNGVKNAFRLLAELKEFEEFEEFLTELSQNDEALTITEFIQKPLEYVRNLVLCLQSALLLTPQNHPDTNSLSQVVENLRNTCNRINDSNTRRSTSMTSLASRSRSSSSRMSTSSSSKCSRSSTSSVSSCSSSGSHNSKDSSPNSSISSTSAASASSSPSSSSSGGIESSLDPEVLEIQRRLVFAADIPAFQLATATRHMIYSGEVTHVEGEKLYLVLMSDLILVTKAQEDGSLLVVDFPILLQNIVDMEFGETDTYEFGLTVESDVDEEWVEDCDIVLAATTMEEKYTWKNLLDQRIRSCNAERDFLNLENFV